jgi:hypothetical protein
MTSIKTPRTSLIRSNQFIGLTPLMALGLQACGGVGTTATTSSGSSFSAALSGNVVKGPLTGAVVFLDRNNNGTLDEGEESAATGPGGAYNLQVVGDIPDGAQIVVITSGAKDESTGKTLDADVVLKAPATSKVITPLTTMASAAGLTAAEVATALGLADDIDIFEFNPFEEKDSTDTTRQEAAAKLEAVAVMVTKNIVEISKAAGGGAISSSNLSTTVDAAAEAFKSVVQSGSTVTLDTLASNDFLNDMITDVKANSNNSNWDINDVDTTEIANTLTGAKVVEEKGLNDQDALDALKSISKGASVLNVVVLEAGAENALAPILLFEQMFDEWVENGYSGTQLTMVNDDGVFKLQVVIDGTTLAGEIVLTGTNLDAADPTAGTVTRIDFYAPFATDAVMYMDLPEGATTAEVKAVLEGWYGYEYGGGDYFSLFPPSGDPENDQFVTILAEKASTKGAIMDLELFGGADKIVSGSQYDDIIALYDQEVSKNFDGEDITPTVGTTRVYSLDGADRILPLLFDKDALIGDVTVKDFKIGSDVIDLSVAGLSYKHIISEAYTDSDGVKGVKLWFDFDLDGTISTSDRGEVHAENSRGSIFLEGITKAKWDAQIESDPSVIVIEGATNLTANWDEILDFDKDGSLLDDDSITPNYTPDPTDAFVVRYLNSMGSAPVVSADGKTATQNIYERTVDKPAGDSSIIIGKATLYGSGFSLDPDTGFFVSGFVDRAEITTESGEIAFDWEGFATADEFNEGTFLDGLYGHMQIAAWMSGFSGDNDLDDLADNRYGDWDDSQFETTFLANLKKFGITVDGDNKVYYEDSEVTRFDYNDSNSWSVIRQFASWLDNQSETGSVGENLRASEQWTVNLSQSLERYESGYLIDGVSMGVDDTYFGGSINDTPFNDMIELGSSGKDYVDLRAGGSDLVTLDSFYTPSYTDGVDETNTTLGPKIYYTQDVLDLIPENYVDRDEITGFNFSSDANEADYLTTVSLPESKGDFFSDNNGDGIKDETESWTEWWGMRQSFDVDSENGVEYQEGNLRGNTIQEISVAYGDLDGDGKEDDVLLTFQNVSEWYQPEGSTQGGWSVNADYEIALIDPIGLDGVSESQLETVVSKHIYMNFVNNRLSSDGESYFADPVSLYALDQWKEYLVDDVGLSLVDTKDGVTLTYQDQFIANPSGLDFDTLEDFVNARDLV